MVSESRGNRLIDVSLEEARELKNAFPELFKEAIEEASKLPEREMTPDERQYEEWMRPKDLTGEIEAMKQSLAWIYPDAKVRGPTSNYKMDIYGGHVKGRHLVGVVFNDDGIPFLIDNPVTGLQRILYDKIESYLGNMRKKYTAP